MAFWHKKLSGSGFLLTGFMACVRITMRENVFLRVYEEPDHEATEGVHTY
jgi:hypothetical protein